MLDRLNFSVFDKYLNAYYVCTILLLLFCTILLSKNSYSMLLKIYKH